MKPSLIVSSLLVLTACSAAESIAPGTAKDAPDEPSAAAPGAAAPAADQGPPLADRMRSLDKTIYNVSLDGLPTIGSADALVTVVLFTDYECPFCGRLDRDQLAKLRAQYGEDVRVAVAMRPLPFHKNARPAALAALAAANQGKFAAMHDKLVALEAKVDEAAIVKAATEIGLDLARFDVDRKGAAAERALTHADDLAKKFSVEGTPTVFVNGRRITGAQPVFTQLVKEEHGHAKALVGSGVQRSAVYATLTRKGLDHADKDPSVTIAAPEWKTFSVHMKEVNECWSSHPAAKEERALVEVTIRPDGSVARTEPAAGSEVAACVAKLAQGWTFEKREGESKIKFGTAKNAPNGMPGPSFFIQDPNKK